jgi:hypothetical protein
MELSILLKVINYNYHHRVLEAESMLGAQVTCYVEDLHVDIEHSTWVHVEGLLLPEPIYSCHDFINIPDNGIYVDVARIKYLSEVNSEEYPWYRPFVDTQGLNGF